ncbi:MAG: carboxylating nicotinate-nucleotide diphosphorylase [Treponema sp.]|nr:carboxylating nicotinate-nucleotide diphosphorylase [Treponema sp.]
MDDMLFGTLLGLALEEDLDGVGDVTSRAIFADGDRNGAVLTSKDTGILCGIERFREVFRRVDPSVQVGVSASDGDRLRPGMEVARIEGPTRSILEAERTAINFLSFLSGIATAVDEYVRAARENGKAVILDTRKTLPGYRALSKYAVRVGGGSNHRMGLYDMVMIKDNHIDAAGGIAPAVERVRARWGRAYRVEVECRSLDEVRQAIEAGADVVMLDNMDVETARRSLELRIPGVSFEASGGISLETVGPWSALGVDYISVGRLTHSVRAFDFSLTIRREDKP